MLKIAIAGGGWYGCHMAVGLVNLGFEIELYERSDDIFALASSKNQNRLHQGFHYARNYRTRLQSKIGFNKFTQRYPELIRAIDKNLYVIPKHDSLIDFETYQMIMASSGLHFTEVEHGTIEYLQNIVGAINTSEKLICWREAREYFHKRLSGHLKINSAVHDIRNLSEHVKVNGRKYDFLIDCTWGQLCGIEKPIFYEPVMLLLYEGHRDHREHLQALTFVDGPLCSIYPLDLDSVYTLSSVPYSPLGKFSDFSDAQARIKNVTADDVFQKRRLMEAQIKTYYPSFSEDYQFIGHQCSIKTKISGADDDRSCYVQYTGRVATVMSGKIDNIFFAFESVLEHLEQITDIKRGQSTE